MKLHLNRFSGPLVAFTLVSAPPFLAAEKQAQPPAQAPAPQAAAPQKNAPAATPAQPDAPRAIIRLAEHDSKDHAAKKFVGDDLRGSDGRALGKVKDFLLDPQSGKVDFAVISSGGIAGMGDKLRLVPIPAMKRAGKDEFTVDVNAEQWKRLSTLDEDEFKSGEVTITDTQRRQITQNFEHRTQPSSESSFYTASLTNRLVRASELSGRTVRAGSGKLGEIEAIVLDLAAGTAQALVDPNKDFTGTKAKLLVPFDQFTISLGKRPQVTTLLTRSDFLQLRPGGSAATGIAASTSSAPSQPAMQPSATQSKEAPAVASTQSTTGNQKSPDQTASASATPATPSKTMPAVASAPPSPDHQKSPAQAASAPAASAPSAPATPPQSAVATSTPSQPQPQATTPAAPDPTTSSARVAATDKSPAAKSEKGENLSPTGKTSADTIPADTDPLLLATARAIRKALDDDPALARADVRVTPEEGKIVLRGRVNDQKTKTAIIEKATSEVKGWKIDDQISLDNR